MGLSKDRIIALGTSPHLHEQSAINFAISSLPDRDPFRLWGLIDLVDPGGRRYDLDLVVIGYHAVYLIEIKSHPGRIKGDTVDWQIEFPDGGRTTIEHPGRLAEYKSRVLASLLQRQMSRNGQQAPWVQHLIFASAEGVSLNLPGAAGNHVVTRENFLRALQFGEYAGATSLATRREINRPQALEVVKALKALGLRESHASLKVNDMVLGKLLAEHENYQDHLAQHESIPTIQARVRTYQVAHGVTIERRKQLTNAAEREARHLALLSDHPNILKLRTYIAHGPTEAPCIVFEHLDGELPLDAFLRANPDLSLNEKVGLVTRIGEALAYCHRKSILHRGLAPSAVLVRRNPDDAKKLDVRLFNFQLASQSESATGTAHYTSHLTAWRVSSEDVFVAPEVLEKPENANYASDLFSLGALTYLILVGRPPGQTLVERETLLRRGYLSPATARDELAAGMPAAGLDQAAVAGGEHKGLEEAMEFATEKNPVNRGDDVVSWLGFFADALSSPSEGAARAYVDPLEAKNGDEIAPDVLVAAVLGTGSTARTLRIVTNDGTFALKVSLSSELDARLRRESEILESLQKDGRSSDRIVRLHEVLEIGGRTCLRLTDAGQTVARVLAEEGAQSVDYAKRWGEDLLVALEYLEENGVQHRDIKPGNLGVLSADQKRRRQLLLFDFSLSAAEAKDIRLGTPAYRDPFLAQRGQWDDAADRYAVAVTLHELLTGERPRFGANDIASASEDEITLSAERFDATVRDRLVAFFRRSLARDVAKRFGTAEHMRTEWVACFASSHVRGAGEDLATPISVSPLTAALPQGLNLQTSVESLPLPARAKNALFRVGVLRVVDLLRLPNNQLSALRGVGRGTAREILEFIQRPEFAALKPLLAQEPALVVAAAAETPPDAQQSEIPRTLDGWVNAVLPPVTKNSGEKPLQHVRHLWGLDQLKGRHIDSVAELASTLGVTRPLIYQALEKMRQRWLSLPFLEDLRGLVKSALEATGGQAPLSALGVQVATALDRSQPVVVGDNRAEVLVRVAAEMSEELSLSRVNGVLWIVPVDCDVRSLERLGVLADELAQAEPLLSPGGAVAQLRIVAAQGPFSTLGDEPLVALAVAASKQAAKSARLEIYPRGLAASRALDLCLSALPPAGLDAPLVAHIVSARYPHAQPLPTGEELGGLLLARGYSLDAKTGKFLRRGLGDMAAGTVAGITRAHTTHTAHREKIDPAAQEFAKDIEVRQRKGSFCVLEVQPAYARQTAEELGRRLLVSPVSVDGLLLKFMDLVINENEVDRAVVFATDREGPTSDAWVNLKGLMEQAADKALAELGKHTKPLVLTEPGLLARFGLLRFLKQLVEHTRQDDAPAVFLIVPSAEEAGGGVRIAHPAGDLPIPLTSPAQHLLVPKGWLGNLDKGNVLRSTGGGA